MAGLSGKFNDPVADSPHIKRDVDRAVRVLKEEGYVPTDDEDVLLRRNGAGESEYVHVSRGTLNGMLTFMKNGVVDRTVMAWDYTSEQRPGPVQRALDAVRGFLSQAPSPR